MKRALTGAGLAALSLTVLALTADRSFGSEPTHPGISLVSGSSSSVLSRYTRYRLAESRLRRGVLGYAQGKLGKQDGNGECWTLVDDALRSAGADTGGDGKYVFGNAVSLSALQPGDLLQFEGVTFEHHNANGSWYSSSYPHHSAIVESVSGRTVTLLNQNVNGNRTVQRSTVNLDDHKGGTITAFEPKIK